MSRKRRAELSVRWARTGAIEMSLQGIRSSVLCELADDRIREANILLSHGQHTGAAYIAGYAVELLLKAILAARANAGVWPLDHNVAEYRTHDFEDFLKLCGLREQMRQSSAKNFELGSNWVILREWRTDLRYRRLQRALAADIVQAVSDQRDGVARWLRVRV
jgi:HEPN domain-containing protein